MLSFKCYVEQTELAFCDHLQSRSHARQSTDFETEPEIVSVTIRLSHQLPEVFPASAKRRPNVAMTGASDRRVAVLNAHLQASNALEDKTGNVASLSGLPCRAEDGLLKEKVGNDTWSTLGFACRRLAIRKK